MRTIAVVGASLAGWRAAQELREQGFDGHLVIVGAEQHPPYDRPPLSKGFLAGQFDTDDIALASDDEHAELRAEWLLGRRAVALSTRHRSLTLDDGTKLLVDGVVVATGSQPRSLPGVSGLPGVQYLRTVDDALSLRTQIAPGIRVVVVGGGLVGTEVASTCRALGAKVTVVEMRHVPLSRTLGVEMGAVCASLHGDHGVRTRFGSAARSTTGRSRVTGVELTDGRVVPADLVAVSVGARPTTEWLRGSGVTVRDGVLCDAGCVSRHPNVVATGDVARYATSDNGRTRRLDCWATAIQQPRIAVENLLAGRTVRHYRATPYFESEQYGVRLQFAGESRPQDKIRIAHGSVDERRFVATYHRAGRTVAALAMNSAKAFSQYRRRLDS